MKTREEIFDGLKKAIREMEVRNIGLTQPSWEAILLAGVYLKGKYNWIPVEERLPETIDWYLCYNDLEDGCEVLHWEGDGNVWMDNDWHYKDKEVTHWMQLPQPPRKEE